MPIPGAEAPAVALVTGIYPPDIGGPATHANDLASELRRRGYRVQVLSLADGRSGDTGPGVVRFPRAWPWPLRLVAVAAWLAARRRSYAVVYATGMQLEAVLGATLARRPIVVKVVGDPAWERGRRLGLVEEGFDAFQGRVDGPWRVRAMRAARCLTVRRATAVTTPSAALAATVDGWLGRPGATEVVPNGAQRRHGPPKPPPAVDGTLDALFVGRLVSHKHVEIAVRATAATAGVRLEVVGDGPELDALRGLVARLGAAGRVTFAGRLGHADVLERMAAAHVLVNPASYEGLPHTLLEAFACSTPVVASAVGGTTEVVTDGVNGLLVDSPTAEGFAAALGRLRDDPALLACLTAGAEQSGKSWSLDACVERVEAILSRAAGSPGSPNESKPRAAFVGKTALSRPPRPELCHKFAVLDRHLHATAIVVGHPRVGHEAGVGLIVVPRLRPAVLGGALHHLVGAAVGVVLAAGRPRGAVVCQSPYEAVPVVAATRLVPPGRRPLVVVEVHGDWRTAARLYGGWGRRTLAPLADRAAAWSLRRADRVRVVSRSTGQLVRDAGFVGAVDSYPAFADLAPLVCSHPTPLPEAPRVAFVGALQRSKGPDVLADAWATVVRVVPAARLVIAGDGPLRGEVGRRLAASGAASSVEMVGHVTQSSVAAILDDSWLLALPSRTEGLPRVLLESMARGRAVVGAGVGGVPEVVRDGDTGILVPPGDPEALAAAIVKLLCDPALVARLGNNARAAVEADDPARQFEEGTARLAAWITEAGHGRGAG